MSLVKEFSEDLATDKVSVSIRLGTRECIASEEFNDRSWHRRFQQRPECRYVLLCVVVTV